MQMMVDCCAIDDTACLTLKEEFPELQSTDPDMNPDFCAMHGNVCTRWAEALLMPPSIPARRSIVSSPYVCAALLAYTIGLWHCSGGSRAVEPHQTYAHTSEASRCAGLVLCRDGYLLELCAFAGGDLACVFPAESIMATFSRLRRIDLSGNRIAGK
jgi:hypothetical protein